MDRFELDDLDYWRLCDELSIKDAALLVVGENPVECSAVEEWPTDQRPRGYQAARTAITNALRGGRIEGEVLPEQIEKYDGDGEPIPGTVSVYRSRVKVDSLREWLASRGFRHGFFFPAEADTPGYLNPTDPRYAPKLAAAVRAWLAVSAPAGKHPKQALVKWLRENAAEFGLTDDEGKPNETGIEEAAKVANWQPAGGAPKTPVA